MPITTFVPPVLSSVFFILKFEICFGHLVLLEMITLRQSMKITSVQNFCTLLTRNCGGYLLKDQVFQTLENIKIR